MSLNVDLIAVQEVSVFDASITHNLGEMAKEAGIYMCIWRPEEIGIKYAKDLIGPLEEGLQRLNNNPEHYKKFNPTNGWGNYEGLVYWVERYIEECKENPDATVEVSR